MASFKSNLLKAVWQNQNTTIMALIMINQLPDYMPRWQHGSHICFEPFIEWKIINSANTELREIISTDFKFWENLIKFFVRLSKFKNHQILHNKISHRFLVTAKLFTRWNLLITTAWSTYRVAKPGTCSLRLIHGSLTEGEDSVRLTSFC
jgi:hypothetical protein